MMKLPIACLAAGLIAAMNGKYLLAVAGVALFAFTVFAPYFAPRTRR